MASLLAESANNFNLNDSSEKLYSEVEPLSQLLSEMNTGRLEDADTNLNRIAAFTQRARVIISYAAELKSNEGSSALINSWLDEFFQLTTECNAEERRAIYRNLSSTRDSDSNTLTISDFKQLGRDLNLSPEHKKNLLSLYERFLEDQKARDDDGKGSPGLKDTIEWLRRQVEKDSR